MYAPVPLKLRSVMQPAASTVRRRYNKKGNSHTDTHVWRVRCGFCAKTLPIETTTVESGQPVAPPSAADMNGGALLSDAIAHARLHVKLGEMEELADGRFRPALRIARPGPKHPAREKVEAER